VTASVIHATSNGAGTNFRVGDDAWIGDINVADTISIKGISGAATNGFIRFGSDGNGFGYNGTSLIYNGDVNFDSNTLFINAANSTVGINTITASSSLHVNGTFVVQGVNSYSASRYTLAISDIGKVITASHTTTNIVVIPASATINFPIGSTFNIVQYGASATSASRATTDITLNFYSPAASANPTLKAQFAAMSLIKTAANTWLAVGNII
jgi:hypothetical protein